MGNAPPLHHGVLHRGPATGQCSPGSISEPHRRGAPEIGATDAYSHHCESILIFQHQKSCKYIVYQSAHRNRQPPVAGRLLPRCPTNIHFTQRTAMSELWPKIPDADAGPAPRQYRDSMAYYPEAEKAQRFEQRGDYVRAFQAWMRANYTSCNELNRQWSRSRAEFCEKFSLRGH
ncbi:hypothetical protein SAMN03159353_10541 [Cedecea sp. NFIX57]|nr:hypothetical protein SAMN03159353_10541 [Cedecea sp. NFIX57]